MTERYLEDTMRQLMGELLAERRLILRLKYQLFLTRLLLALAIIGILLVIVL